MERIFLIIQGDKSSQKSCSGHIPACFSLFRRTSSNTFRSSPLRSLFHLDRMALLSSDGTSFAIVQASSLCNRTSSCSHSLREPELHVFLFACYGFEEKGFDNEPIGRCTVVRADPPGTHSAYLAAARSSGTVGNQRAHDSTMGGSYALLLIQQIFHTVLIAVG